MIKKVSIIALTVAISLDSIMVYAKPKRNSGKKARASAVAKINKKNTASVVKDIEPKAEAIKAPIVEEVQPVAPTQKVTIIDNSVTNDLNAIRAAVRDEIQANNQAQEQASITQANELLAQTEASNKAKENQKIKEATAALSQKVEEVRSECSGIKSNIDTIFGLTVATTVSSGLGTAAAGGALAVGLVKANKDKKAEEQGTLNENRDYKEEYKVWKAKFEEVYSDTNDEDYSKLLSKAKTTKDLLSAVNKENKDLDKSIEKAEKILKEENSLKRDADKVKENQDALRSAMASSLTDMNSITEEQYSADAAKVKDTKLLGHLRTGLLAGATVTSAVSLGTSIGATMNAGKLADKMSSCNAKVKELNLAKNTLEAELEEAAVKPEIITTAQNIISSCTGFDEGNIKTLKNMMTASAVVSGIGTTAAGTGTVTSFMANTDKVRNNDSEEGKAKEKKLNLVSNIAAGVATGTSATSTTLSAISLTKAKKDSETAERCESAL